MNPSIKKHKSFISLLLILPISFVLFSSVLVYAETEEENPTLKEKKVQEGYILNIRDLIKKSKEKIEEANEKIKDQAVRRRNLQREEKARDYYDKAMRYYEQGNLKKAQDYWEKAIEITDHPEMRGYLKESVKKTKAQKELFDKEETRRLKRLELERGYTVKEVEEIYDTAVSLFKQNKFLVAKEEFENVEEMFPDHRATRSYLMIIDQKIQEDQQAAIDEKIKKEAYIRRQEKEAWRKELDKREENRRAKMEKQAEVTYQDALKYYRAREFEKAKERFKEVEFILPDYKSTVRYLAKVDQEIEKDTILGLQERKEKVDREYDDEKALRRMQEERRILAIELKERDVIDRLKEEAGFIYDAAIVLYEKGELYRAREKFAEVKDMYPDYKYVQKYIDRIDLELEKDVDKRFEKERREFEYQMAEKEKERERLEKIALLEREKAELDAISAHESKAESLYRKAISLFDSGLLEDAYAEFEEMQMLYPKYKDVERYLDRIDEKLEQQKREEEETLRLLHERKLREEKLAKEREEARRLKLIEEEEQEWIKRLEEEAGVMYESAVSHYNKKLYSKAKDKFEEVQLLYPDYKATTKYLDNIDFRIEEEKRIEHDKEQIEFERQLKEERLQKQREEKARRLKEEKAENERIRQLNASAEEAYRIAVLLYKKQLYVQAEEKFQAVQGIIPGYKKTDSFLEKIKKEVLDAEIKRKEQEQKDLAIKLREEQLEKKRLEEKRRKQLLEEARQQEALKEEAMGSLYKSGIKYYKKKLYKIAKEKFEKVRKEYPHYKLVDRYLIEIEGKIKGLKLDNIKEQRKLEEQKLKEEEFEKKKALLEQSRLERLKEKEEEGRLRKEADILYKSALILCKKKLYSECRKKFLEVEKLAPGYKSTAKYIERLNWLDKGSLDSIDASDKEVEVKSPVDDKKPIDDNKIVVEELEYQASKERMKVASEVAAASQLTAMENQTEEELYIRKEEEKRNKMFLSQAEEKYKEAIRLYKSDNFIDAKIKFIQVEAIVPGYQDTPDYLYNIDADIERNQEKLRKNRIMSKEAKAKASEPKKEEKGTEISAKRFEQEAREMYQRAVKLYKEKQYELARVKFMEIDQLIPGYKKTDKYISKIDRAIEKNIKKNELNDRSQDVEKSKKSEIKEKQALKKSREMSRDDQRSDQLSGQMKQETSKIKENEKAAAQILNKQAEDAYARAVKLYKKKEYESARFQFVKVVDFVPDFKRSTKYISKIDNIIAREEAKAQQQKIKADKEPARKLDWEKEGNKKVSKIKKDLSRIEKIESKKNKKVEKQLRREDALLAKKQSKLQSLDESEEKEAVRIENKKNNLLKEIEKVDGRIRERFDQAVTIEEWEKAGDLRAAKIKAQEAARNYVEEKNYEDFRQKQIEMHRIEEEQARQRKILEKQEKRRALKAQKEKDKLLKKSIQEARHKEEEEIEIIEKLQDEKIKEKEKVEQKAIEAERKAEEKAIEAERKAQEDLQHQETLAIQQAEKDALEQKIAEQEALLEQERLEKESAVEIRSIKRALTRSEKKKRKIVKKQAKAIARLQKEKEQQDTKRMKRAKSLFVDLDSSSRKKTEREQRKIINKQQKMIQEIKKEDRRADRSKWGSSIDDIYLDGLKSFENENYEAAKVLFSLVEELDPGHNEAKKYNEISELKLQKMNKIKLAKEEKAKKMEQEKIDRVLQKELQEKEKAQKAEELKEKEEKEKVQRLENAKKKDLLSGLKVLLEKEYREAVACYKKDEVENTAVKFKNIEQMLTDNEFEEKFEEKVIARMSKIRDAIQKKLEEEKRKNELVMKQHEEQLQKEKEKLEAEKKKELDRLKANLEAEQKKIEAEKLKEKLIIDKLKQKEAILAAKEKLKEEKIKRKEDERKRREEAHMLKLERIEKEKERKRSGKMSGKKLVSSEEVFSREKSSVIQDSAKKQEVEQSEKEKQQQLMMLVKKRQKELQEERENVRAEFEENIEVLYQKAGKLFKENRYNDAKEIFGQIEDLKPGYKDCDEYLKKITNSMMEAREKIRVEKNRIVPDDDLAEEEVIVDEDKLIESELKKTRAEIIKNALDSIEVKH